MDDSTRLRYANNRAFRVPLAGIGSSNCTAAAATSDLVIACGLDECAG